jgi:uncharacterized protein (TIGR03437 family)
MPISRFAVLPAAVVFLSGILCAQAVSFLPPGNAFVASNAPPNNSIYTCATCIAAADFNGDGKTDIAFNIESSPALAGVALGNGDGTFRPGVTFSYSQSLVGGMFVADFNGDGKPDLLLSGSTTALLTGNGDGTFASPMVIGACTSQVSASADFNGDGKADLICGTSVLLGNGDGTFHSAGTVGTIAMESVVLVADFNNDGKPDVLLEEVSGLQLAVALGRGDGTFGASSIIGSSAALYLTSVLAGDFNGDGKVDLAAYAYSGLIFIDVLPGNGDGTFGSPVQTGISRVGGLQGPLSATADFNKDGKLDLVAGDAIFAGNGDGTFRFPVYFGPVAQPCGSAPNPAVQVPCDYGHAATVVADFNGDGLPDLAAGSVVVVQTNFGYAVTALLNDSPGDGFTASGVSSATLTAPAGSDSLVSAFGVNLAPAAAAASTNPAPTTLGGIRLHVRDRSHTGDTLAPLLYVSPTQINYVLNSTDPYAWVDIERVGSPYVPQGMTVPIASVAPGLFSVGAGLAAASALNFDSNGNATVVPVISCTGQSCGAVPIDVSSGSVYLSLYGTGWSFYAGNFILQTIAPSRARRSR